MSQAKRNLTPAVPAEPTDPVLDSKPIGLLRAPRRTPTCNRSTSPACPRTTRYSIRSALGARRSALGEIGITGVAGALANAVFHATGKRIRNLPITLDKLL